MNSIFTNFDEELYKKLQIEEKDYDKINQLFEVGNSVEDVVELFEKSDIKNKDKIINLIISRYMLGILRNSLGKFINQREKTSGLTREDFIQNSITFLYDIGLMKCTKSAINKCEIALLLCNMLTFYDLISEEICNDLMDKIMTYNDIDKTTLLYTSFLFSDFEKHWKGKLTLKDDKIVEDGVEYTKQ